MRASNPVLNRMPTDIAFSIWSERRGRWNGPNAKLAAEAVGGQGDTYSLFRSACIQESEHHCLPWRRITVRDPFYFTKRVSGSPGRESAVEGDQEEQLRGEVKKIKGSPNRDCRGESKTGREAASLDEQRTAKK